MPEAIALHRGHGSTLLLMLLLLVLHFPHWKASIVRGWGEGCSGGVLDRNHALDVGMTRPSVTRKLMNNL
jgi:hypothetical protein